MTQDEEEQMRMAIEESLRNITRSPPMSPRRMTQIPSPVRSPRNNYEDELEDPAIQEAIQASITAAAEARIAAQHANNINTTRTPPMPIVSPGTERRQIIEQQNREFEEALRIDRENAEQARLAAEAAARAAAAAEAAARALREAQANDEARRNALRPPNWLYPITADTPQADIVSINFRFPSGMSSHRFNVNEPMSSLLQQLRVDTKHLGNFKLVSGIGRFARTIDCPPEATLRDCGLEGGLSINVTLLD
jgi:hypothetical protein